MASSPTRASSPANSPVGRPTPDTRRAPRCRGPRPRSRSGCPSAPDRARSRALFASAGSAQPRSPLPGARPIPTVAAHLRHDHAHGPPARHTSGSGRTAARAGSPVEMSAGHRFFARTAPAAPGGHRLRRLRRQTRPPFCPPPGNHRPAGPGLHPDPEAMRLFATAGVRLKSPLHSSPHDVSRPGHRPKSADYRPQLFPYAHAVYASHGRTGLAPSLQLYLLPPTTVRPRPGGFPTLEWEPMRAYNLSPSDKSRHLA